MSVTIQVKKSRVSELKRALTSRAVYAGIPADSNPYPDGTSVVKVAVDHEFGSSTARSYTSPRGNKVSVSGIPERSFMRSTAKEKRTEWSKAAVAHIKRVLRFSGDIETAVESVGIQMVDDIRDKIVTISDPPNSPQVIADKGSSNPLIDTGHLKGSITYDVRAK